MISTEEQLIRLDEKMNTVIGQLKAQEMKNSSYVTEKDFGRRIEAIEQRFLEKIEALNKSFMEKVKPFTWLFYLLIGAVLTSTLSSVLSLVLKI